MSAAKTPAAASSSTTHGVSVERSASARTVGDTAAAIATALTAMTASTSGKPAVTSHDERGDDSLIIPRCGRTTQSSGEHTGGREHTGKERRANDRARIPFGYRDPEEERYPGTPEGEH